MKCVELFLALAFFYSASASAEFDNRLLQTFDNVIDDGIVSDKCQQALDLYLENLQATLGGWAFKMLDATSKLPVGLLSFNMGELGQFTQCLSTESDDGLIQPKYCLTTIPLTALANGAMDNKTAAIHQKFLGIRHAARSLANLQSAQDDESASAQSGIRWAICLPSDCSDEDVGDIFASVLGSIPVSCQTKEDANPPLTDGAIATIVVLAFFAFLLVVSTAVDLYCRQIDQKPPHVLLVAFSAYSNGQKLFRISHNSNELTCLNGIRFLSMMWVLVGHVFSTYLGLALTNYIDMMNWTEKLRSMTILSGTLSVDSFFVLSGLLVVYSYMKAKHHGVNFNIFQFYIHRYLRLTPALAATVLVTANLLKYMGSGPLWTAVPTFENTCQKYWWSTLLYVQNYVNVNATCLPQSWYLSVDMQLYIIAPLVLYPIWKYPKIGMGIVLVCIGAFIAVPFTIAYINELPALMTNFNDQVGLMKYMTMYYLKTHTRAAPWFIGVFIGYLLARIKFEGGQKDIKLNKILVFVIWIICLAVGATCVYGGHSTLRGVEFDKWGNSLYIGFVRPVWSVCLAWVIFACVSGYGGPINWLLSLPIYQVLNRFTYSVYLIHYPLMLIYAYMSKTGVYFDELTLAWSFWGLTMFSFVLSVFWVLAFESPIVILEKLIFGGAKKSNKVEDTGNKKELPA